MARKLRLRYPGAIYHVMKGRGHREPIFANDQDHVEAGVEENVPFYGERRRGSLTMQEKRTKRCGGNLTISLTSWSYFEQEKTERTETKFPFSRLHPVGYGATDW